MYHVKENVNRSKEGEETTKVGEDEGGESNSIES